MSDASEAVLREQLRAARSEAKLWKERALQAEKLVAQFSAHALRTPDTRKPHTPKDPDQVAVEHVEQRVINTAQREYWIAEFTRRVRAEQPTLDEGTVRKHAEQLANDPSLYG
jgi:hypothetical protein